jgi:raffinose/stachyose/melibiose transport system substrate-binding protein
MKKAVDQLNELAQKGYFGDNYMSDEFADAEGYMASGEFAMCMLKPGAIKTIVASDMNTAGYTEDDFGLFVLPIVDNQYLNIHPTGPSRFIYSGSKNIDAAKQYLSYICRKESVQYVIDNAADVENMPLEVGQTPEYSNMTKEFLASYDDEHSGMVLQDVVLYFNEQWMDINADLAAMFIGDMTSDDVLKGIDERRTQLAQAAGDPNWK